MWIPVLSFVLQIVCISGFHTPERVRNAVSDLHSIGFFESNELNRLRVLDFFVLANRTIPEYYARSDGSLYAENREAANPDSYVVSAVNEVSDHVISSWTKAAAALPNPASLPNHAGLDGECSNMLCNMMEYLVSCKAIGLGIKKICATYLFGNFYGCSNFPSYTDAIYDAPSICLVDYLSLFADLALQANGSSDAFSTTITNYLFKNYSTNSCDRRCYQRYQNFSNEFYLNCNSQLRKYNQSYPMAYALSNFQQFRNQGCARNNLDRTCYSEITNTFAFVTNATVHGKTVSPDITTDYTCQYYGSSSNATLEAKNIAVLQNSCKTLSAQGCCAGHGIALVQLNQIELLTSKGKTTVIFPPCWLNYLRLNCSDVQLQEMCTAGSVATQTTVQGYFQMLKGAGPLLQFFPNVYNHQLLLQTQALLTGSIGALGFTNEPYNFNSKSPFQVYIVGYEYYAANGTLLTPKNGVPAVPAGSDYGAAASGKFYYQVVVQNLNSTQAESLQTKLSSPMFVNILANAFHTSPTTTSAQATSSNVFASQPNPVKSSASKSCMLMNTVIFSLIIIFTQTTLFLQN